MRHFILGQTMLIYMRYNILHLFFFYLCALWSRDLLANMNKNDNDIIERNCANGNDIIKRNCAHYK